MSRRRPRPERPHLGVDAFDGPLGPGVRLTLNEVPLLLPPSEARQLAEWLCDAAVLAETHADMGEPDA